MRTTRLLDKVLPVARLCETAEVELAGPPERVYEFVRERSLSVSPWIRALFAVRTLPSRLAGKDVELDLRFDKLSSSEEHPGFQILCEEPPHELVVGAIGKVWSLDIPFVHVAGPREFAAFSEPGLIKVAWAISVSRLGEHDSRLSFEVRADATDEESWRKFRAYFRLIGPGSRFIRRSVMAELARELGTPEELEQLREMRGDQRLADADAELTHGITIRAKPEEIWPWLEQMGGGRAGFYSIDWLDNDGAPSARELHPETAPLHVGDVIPALPNIREGFEVLELDPPHALVLGGLFDRAHAVQLPFDATRPESYWHVTWAYVLEPLDEVTTRLHVRVRGAYSKNNRGHATMMRAVHHVMETVQLHRLRRRVEARVHREGLSEVIDGIAGALITTFALITPFLRVRRSIWGLDDDAAARVLPGDHLIPEPRWSWTHGIEIDAPPERVWPWLAQVGADRAGFYSYQWLENLFGCELSNAERVHPEWDVAIGGALRMHPKMPPLEIVEVLPGRAFVAYAGGEASAASWLFFVEPLGEGRSRVISRFRSRCADDLRARIAYGPTLIEPVSFAMDRRMLLGIKDRVERTRFDVPLSSLVRPEIAGF